MTWIDLLSESIRNLPVDGGKQGDVDALLAFHRTVGDSVTAGGGGRQTASSGEAARRCEAFRLMSESLSTGHFDRKLRFPIDPDVVRPAYDAAVRIGDGGGALAPMCERAAEVIEGRIPADEGALRSFLDDWSGQTALLVARAMGVRGSWQRAGVLSVARAQTLSKHLCRLGRDIPAGFVLFPESDMKRFGVQPHEINSPESTGQRDRLVWKQVIRIQQALAGVVDLVADLDNQPARRIRRWWFTVIELTHATEKIEYDVGRLPEGPTRIQRAQIGFQSLFGRTTFRG